VELIGRFAARACLLCLPVAAQLLAISVGASDAQLTSLNAEIQAIKAEVLAISEALPQRASPAQQQDVGSSPGASSSPGERSTYVSSIIRLQRRAALGSLSEAERLQLARLKLEFGLDVEAGFDLYALQNDVVPVSERSRAWYGLADAYYRKGHYSAAEEALSHAATGLPPDLIGSHQLLQSNVLLALGRNAEAARSLQPWQGEAALAGYAYFNRAVALIRSGRSGEAKAELKRVIRARAKEPEQAALRDKARLSLAYILFQEGESDAARRQLEAVREDGPYASRAMLALSWIARQEGSRPSALASLASVRQGPPTDPDVLESYLLVPALRAEDADLVQASIDYERAMSTYRAALRSVGDAQREILEGDVVAALIEGDDSVSHSEAARLLGPLLASRDLQLIRQDHGDLFELLAVLEQRLSAVSATTVPASQADGRGGSGHESPVDRQAASESQLPDAGQSPTRVQPVAPGTAGREAYDGPALYSSRQIPSLPEIESPPQTRLKPLPETQQSRPRSVQPTPVPEYDPWIKQPPDPTIYGLPDSTVIALPSSGDFFRRPGEQEVEDYAYSDNVPGVVRFNRLRSKNMLPAPEALSSFKPAEMPEDSALREMALALNREAGLRQQGVVPFDSSLSAAEREEQLTALRQQLLALQERVIQMMDRYEVYTRDLALIELERRRKFLAELEQQASLELAKTYDQLSEQ
jgi:tetratricopeptide (TPR) repeat protein